MLHEDDVQYKALFLYTGHEHSHKREMEWDHQRKLLWESTNEKNKVRKGISQTN